MASDSVTARIIPGASIQSGQVYSDAGVPVMVEVVPPEGEKRPKCDICCVVDVSGSMGTEAMLRSEDGSLKGHGLSVLDLVKHALRAIIRTLTDSDRVSLIAYSSEATVIFGLTSMTDNAKREKEAQLSELKPVGMTNLWDGLKKGMDELSAAASSADRLQHIMLFTDGLPNINPPRGILPMVKRIKDKHGGRLPCTVNTFGFGYELDSELLSQLAIDGSGAYAFIPDASFIGTVFVNALGNLLVTMGKDLQIRLEPQQGATLAKTPILGGHVVAAAASSTTVNVGALQYGQRKQIIAHMVLPPDASQSTDYLKASIEYTTSSGLSCVQLEGKWEADASSEAISSVEPQRLRLLLVDTLRKVLQKLKLTNAEKMMEKPLPMEDARSIVIAALEAFASSPAHDMPVMQALKEDLSGQVSEAVSREDWYTKWGLHYLPSLSFAHDNQQCNNFKDAGVQDYGGEMFKRERDNADDIFTDMPPLAPDPATTLMSPTPAAASTAVGGASAAPAQAALAPVVSIAAFHDRYAGCFHGDCPVLLADGSARRAVDVRKGDRLAPALDGHDPAEVLCAVWTKISAGQMPLVTLEGGLRVTPYHPIAVGGVWRFPIDAAQVQEAAQCDVVCTFLLEQGGSAALVSGVPCATLGHGIEEGAAAHPYFGSWRSVHDDLKQFSGFGSGIVELSPDSIQRDPDTAMIVGLRPVKLSV